MYESLPNCIAIILASDIFNPSASLFIIPEIMDCLALVKVATQLIYLQVFCGKIPKDMYEDELIPHFERCGHIWDLRSRVGREICGFQKFNVDSAAVTLFVSRLMMDPMSGLNRGYAFITFTTRDEALEAVKQVLAVCSSDDT